MSKRKIANKAAKKVKKVIEGGKGAKSTRSEKQLDLFTSRQLGPKTVGPKADGDQLRLFDDSQLGSSRPVKQNNPDQMSLFDEGGNPAKKDESLFKFSGYKPFNKEPDPEFRKLVGGAYDPDPKIREAWHNRYKPYPKDIGEQLERRLGQERARLGLGQKSGKEPVQMSLFDEAGNPNNVERASTAATPATANAATAQSAKEGFFSSNLAKEAMIGAGVGAGVGALGSALQGGNLLEGAMWGAGFGAVGGAAGSFAGGKFKGNYMSNAERKVLPGGLNIDANKIGFARHGALGGIAGGLMGKSKKKKNHNRLNTNGWSNGTHPMYFR